MPKKLHTCSKNSTTAPCSAGSRAVWRQSPCPAVVGASPCPLSEQKTSTGRGGVGGVGWVRARDLLSAACSCRSSWGCGAGELLPGLGPCLRHPLHIPGWERACFSPGCPALVQHHCHSATEGQIAWLVGARLAGGCLGWPITAPGPGQPGAPASERSGAHPAAVSGPGHRFTLG